MRDSRTLALVRGCALASIVLTSLLVTACEGADSSEPADAEAAELRGFLDGTYAIPGTEGREEHRHTFARLAVRASGLRASGVDPETEDAWSPVVERSGEGESAADVRGWLGSGDIDAASSFVPLRLPCSRRAHVDPTGLPAEIDRAEIEIRADRLGCALDRLAGREVEIAWTPGLDRGVVLDLETGRASVNPRVVALVEPTSAAALSNGDGPVPAPGAPSGPPREEASTDEEPGARALEYGDNQNHPRPPTTGSGDSSRTWCDRACDDVWNDACDCHSSPGSGATSSGSNGCDCNKGAGSGNGGCGSSACKCAFRGASAQDQAGGLVSLLLAGTLLLRRRRKIRVRARGVVSLLVGLALFACAARTFAGPPAKTVDVRVVVTPAEAAVFVDGNAVTPANGIVGVPAGKHTFSAKLDGYADALEEVVVPDKGTGTLVTLRLIANKGYLVITGRDTGLTIAIDGTPVGAGSYSGLVAPGPHVVAAYVPGGQARSYSVTAIAGQSVTVSTDAPPTYSPPPPPAPPQGLKKPEPPRIPPPVGPYFQLAVGLVWQSSRPYGFEHTDTPAPGFAVGARGGYRFNYVLGLEGQLEYGRIANGGVVLQTHQIDQNGDGVISGGEAATDRHSADYTLESLRIGAVVRLATDGKVNRFVSGVGIGALREWIGLRHEYLEWDATAQEYRSIGTYRHNYEGWSPYLLLEVGYERSIQRFLTGLVAQVTIESVSGIEDEPYNASVQARAGLYLRGGYALW